MKLATTLVLLMILANPLFAADYAATDENGVRIFSKVPPPGVHPRVILSPEDLPAWRKHVVTTYRGKAFFAKRFESKNVIDVLAAIAPGTADEQLIKAYPGIGPGDNHDLLYATMDVIYHQDAVAAKKVCRAIANFARVVLARSKHEPKWGKIEKSIGDIQGNDGIRTGLGELWCRGGADFALAYDFLFNYMTKDQQDICRQALSAATKDLVCWGMHFPRGRGISNWYGYHGELGPMLLAIEGEPGFRPKQWDAFQQMIRDWAEVHIYDQGGSNEDGYTINTSLREGQFTLIAMARRGENHYTRPNIRNYFKWLVLSLVPGEEGGDTVGYSSCRGAPYESAPVLARWAMPGDPLVNYYFMRYKGRDYQLQKRWQYGSWSTLLGMNYEQTRQLPLDMGKLGLPITHVFPYQGLFVTRSDWSEQAAYLNVLARHDAWYDRHENVDRGRFVFAANGRRWAIDRPWGTAQKSADHNLVHIDGLAQIEARLSGARGKAPNARLVEHGDLDTAGKRLAPGGSSSAGVCSYAVVDLSNAYNWQWVHSWEKPGEGWEPETRSFAEIGWPWKRPGQPERLHGSDNRVVPKYNFLGCNFWRKPYNPVAKAWRTAALVRGHHRYAVIADDIKKDDTPRDYGWYMQIPLDLEVKGHAGNEVHLGEVGERNQAGQPVKGARRLLVRFVSPQKVDVKVAKYTLRTDRRTGKPILANRLIGSCTSVEPKFKVVLFPYLVGETLPQTRLSSHTLASHTLASDTLASDTLAVNWIDQQDLLAFTSSTDKPSSLSVKQVLSKRETPKLSIVYADTVNTSDVAAGPRKPPVVSVEPQDKPVVYYNFDEAKKSGVFSSVARVPGKSGHGVAFDGKAGHVRLPRGIGSSTRGSVAFWMKSAAPTGEMAMMFCASSHEKSAGNGGTNEVAVFLSNHGNVCLGVANVKLHGPILTDGHWHHVAATWDKSSDVRLYVDGQSLGKTKHNGPAFAWTGHATLGKPGGDQRFFAGALDEFYIYNRAIDVAEIKQLAKGP